MNDIEKLKRDAVVYALLTRSIEHLFHARGLLEFEDRAGRLSLALAAARDLVDEADRVFNVRESER